MIIKKNSYKNLRIGRLVLAFIVTATVVKGQVTKLVYGDTLYMSYSYNCSKDHGFNLKEKLKSGHYEVYSKSDSIAFKYADVCYKDNKKDSTWTYYYPSGNRSVEENYIAGKENGKQTSYFENGKIRSEGYSSNGFMNGVWFWYNKNGTKQSMKTFFNNTIQGIGVSYFENEQIESIENFKEGVLDGSCIYFHKNGQLQREVYYIKDRPTGLWNYFNEKGELVRSNQY